MKKPTPPKTYPYRPAVITFLDILGFTDLVAKSHDATAIRQILRRLSSFAADGDEAEDEIEETHAVVFSDSVVRVRFIDGDDHSGALFQEVLKLLHVQGEMLMDDVLLRGGVTVGDIYLEDQLAFGPGFIRAYQLESQFANYPRIVVGPEVFARLRADPRFVADHHDVEDEIHYQSELLRRGDDGIWFVDYLYGFREEMDDPGEHVNVVAKHRALIIKSANAAKPDSRVLQKHLWLARYLNDVVQRLGQPDLAITQKDVPALEELLEKPAWVNPPPGPVIGSYDFDVED